MLSFGFLRDNFEQSHSGEHDSSNRHELELCAVVAARVDKTDARKIAPHEVVCHVVHCLSTTVR